MKRFSLCFFLIFALVFTPVLNAYAFPDTTSHWADTFIQKLVKSGAIHGRPDGKFYPNENMTRSEFTKVFCVANGFDPGNSDGGHWASRYIATAENVGYLERYQWEFGDVDIKVSRIEIAKMIVKALGKENIAKTLSGKNTGFIDDEVISDANKGYVIIARAYGIINGRPDGLFAPNSFATRGEAAKMVVTYLENKDNAIDLTGYEPPVFTTDDVYINGDKVETSHPELLPHIKNGLEIMSMGGYLVKGYSNKSNTINQTLYKDKEEHEKEFYERTFLMDYTIYTEMSKYDDVYLPYSVNLYNVHNSIAQTMFKEIIKDVFPKAYNMVEKELKNKVTNTNYENKIWTKVDGREIRIFTFKGHDQIDVYIAPEK